MSRRRRCGAGNGLDGGLIGPAGQVKTKATANEVLKEGSGAVNEPLVGGDRALSQPLLATGNANFEATEVFVLISERFAGFAPSLADPVGQLDHLINCLLPVEPHAVFGHDPLDIRRSLAREHREGLQEHRNHDLRPSLADDREGAVEIEEDELDFGARVKDFSELNTRPA